MAGCCIKYIKKVHTWISHCIGKEIYCVDTGMADSPDHKVAAQVMTMTFHTPAAGGPAGPKEDQETVGSDSPGENQAGHIRPLPRVYSPAKCTHVDFTGHSKSDSDSGSGYENPPVAHHLKMTDQGEDDNDDVDNDDNEDDNDNNNDDDDDKDDKDDNDDEKDLKLRCNQLCSTVDSAINGLGEMRSHVKIQDSLVTVVFFAQFL